jgi:hypothetical protein
LGQKPYFYLLDKQKNARIQVLGKSIFGAMENLVFAMVCIYHGIVLSFLSHSSQP